MSIRTAFGAACPPFLREYKARVEASPLASRLLRGTFWSLLGTVLSRGLGLLSSIVVARIIGKLALGELGIVQSTVGMFSTIAGLGLGLTATKHVAEHRVADPERLGETIGLLSVISWCSGLLVTFVVLLLAPFLARQTLAAPQLTSELELGALLLLFGVINTVQTGVLSGFEAFKSIARINLICGLTNFPIMFSCTYFGGLKGAVCGLVGALALNCILNFIAVRREASAAGCSITYRHAHKSWTLLWQFGIPGMLSSLITGVVTWKVSTTLVNQPNGYAEMGTLNATNAWFQAVILLPNLLGQVLLPILASYTAVGNRAGLNRALLLSTSVNLALIFPVVAVGCGFSRHIMALYGPGFSEGWPVLVMNLLSAGTLIIQAPITDRLVATSKMWEYFLAHIIWAIVFVTGAYHLVPSHGSRGFALARLLAYLFGGLAIFLLVLWHSRRDVFRGEP